MTPEMLLVAFFLFTLTSVAAAGYVFVMKPARAEAPSGEVPSRMVLNQPDLPAAQAAVFDIFRTIGDALPPAIAKRNETRRTLVAAGYRWPSAVSTFLGIKCAIALTFGVAAAWFAVTFGEGSSLFLPSICGIGFGFMLPDRIIDRMARSRGERLRRGLPAALDLLTLAVEAGQGLDAAILETSRGLRISHPDLASEFTQLQLELRAEPSRSDALRNFAARAQDAELRKFTALLMDTDRFGSSLGPALRTHAHYLRTRFRQSAQERARKVAVKLIFPVFFLIFPSVILVTLGPATILIFQQMNNLLTL